MRARTHTHTHLLYTSHSNSESQALRNSVRDPVEVQVLAALLLEASASDGSTYSVGSSSLWLSDSVDFRFRHISHALSARIATNPSLLCEKNCDWILTQASANERYSLSVLELFLSLTFQRTLACAIFGHTDEGRGGKSKKLYALDRFLKGILTPDIEF